VEMERALETQRVKLLRLLAGWLAVVEIVSVGPLRLELPGWARSFLLSLLIRAEFAAQCLVLVAASLAVKNGSAKRHPAPLPFVKPVGCADDVPSTEMLLRRMRSLRALLNDLSRHGARLLKKRAKRSRPVRGSRVVFAAPCLRDWALADRRIERPPDKCRMSGLPILLKSLPFETEREVNVLVLAD